MTKFFDGPYRDPDPVDYPRRHTQEPDKRLDLIFGKRVDNFTWGHAFILPDWFITVTLVPTTIAFWLYMGRVALTLF